MSDLVRSNKITAFWEGENVAKGVFYKTHTKIKEVNDKIGDVRPLAFADARQAIRYIRENAAKYKIKPDRIAMVGFSAGGAVALDVLYSHDQATKPNLVGLVYAAMSKPEFPSDPCPLFLAATQYEISGLSYSHTTEQVFCL